MSESSFASLNQTLLARKGGAKPAMKPQFGPVSQPANVAHDLNDLDDLGWNDMGDDGDQEREADIVQLNAAPAAQDTDSSHAGNSEVHRQQQKILDRVEKPVTPSSPKKRRSALERGKRAAFTLRLDAERHLKLRLASTVRNRSAQQVVTEALDALLNDMPELESLAAQVKRR